MISKKIETALNGQVESEAFSSQVYLAMASWAETQGYNGTAEFLYHHSDEERVHMLKLIRFINERGGHGVVPALKKAPESFESLTAVFRNILDHEIGVTREINKLVEICLGEKDYTTHNFLQWYVAEQIEEERLARKIMDMLTLIGTDKGGLYLFDRDVASLGGGAGRTSEKKGA